MSITRYFQNNNDGTITVREIEERTWSYTDTSLDTAISQEKDKNKKEVLEMAKEHKIKGINKADIDAKILEQKNRLAGKEK